jgi:preprotein translocase subunit SecG
MVHVVICFILIAVILLQAGRGQGLVGSSFTAGGVQSLFGTRAADFLTKATTVAACLFLVTCIALDIIEAQKSRSLFEAQRPAAPVDVQQIQKVLEKIKAEEAGQGAGEEEAGKTVEAAAEPKPEIPPAGEKG